jgi:hypothetical protein
MDDLRHQLRHHLQRDPQAQIFLAVDSQANYGNVSTVLAAVRSAGVEEVVAAGLLVLCSLCGVPFGSRVVIVASLKCTVSGGLDSRTIAITLHTLPLRPLKKGPSNARGTHEAALIYTVKPFTEKHIGTETPALI